MSGETTGTSHSLPSLNFASGSILGNIGAPLAVPGEEPDFHDEDGEVVQPSLEAEEPEPVTGGLEVGHGQEPDSTTAA